jgi:hypothetical protein
MPVSEASLIYLIRNDFYASVVARRSLRRDERYKMTQPELPLRRAAQYVRMSTEHQQYSTENQSDRIREALLHKSFGGQGSPIPGQTYPTASVTGMPSAVKPLSTVTRTWNSAT